MDIEAVRRKREEMARTEDFYPIAEGELVAYVCDAWVEGDTLPCVEVKVHYGVGGKGMHVCLDTDKNPVMNHPFVTEYLETKGTNIEGGCPTCQEIASGRIKDPEQVKRIRAQQRSLWNIMPQTFRANGARTSSPAPKSGQVVPYMASYSVFDGITEQIVNEGDITNKESPIFIKIGRTGKGQTDTKYKVSPDTDSIRKPKPLSAEQLENLDRCLVKGGSGDLYKIVANMTKSNAAVRALLSGVKTEKETEEEPETAAGEKPDGAPECYGQDISPTDPECQACDFKEGCAAVVGIDVPPDLKKAAPKAAPKAAAAPAKAAPKPAPAAAKKANLPPPPAAEEEPEASTEIPDAVQVKDCELGALYTLPDGRTGEFSGSAKGLGFFQTDEGAVKLPLNAEVAPTVQEEEASPDASAPETAESDAAEDAPAEEAAPAAEEEDPELAQMLAKLETKKKAAAKK